MLLREPLDGGPFPASLGRRAARKVRFRSHVSGLNT